MRQRSTISWLAASFRGDRIHAHHLEPAYLRGTVPTFTRDQQVRPELYR